MWSDKELAAAVAKLRLQFMPYVPHWKRHEWEYVAATILEAAEDERAKAADA